jgi:regulator of protease activity HflC (stomatin/prohibitin superfamily)
MVLIILGIIIFIVGLVLARSEQMWKRYAGVIRVIGLLAIALGFVVSCVVQIDAGFVGVKKLFGKVQTDVLGSGLHFINPLMDVEKLDSRTQNYTMSGIHDEGTKSGDDAIRVLASDGLEVTIDLSVLYRLIPEEAPRLVREIGLNYEDKIVRPITDKNT